MQKYCATTTTYGVELSLPLISELHRDSKEVSFLYKTRQLLTKTTSDRKGIIDFAEDPEKIKNHDVATVYEEMTIVGEEEPMEERLKRENYNKKT